MTDEEVKILEVQCRLAGIDPKGRTVNLLMRFYPGENHPGENRREWALKQALEYQEQSR